MFGTNPLASASFANRPVYYSNTVTGHDVVQDNLASSGFIVDYLILTGTDANQVNMTSNGSILGILNMVGNNVKQINNSTNGIVITSIGNWNFSSTSGLSNLWVIENEL